MDNLSGPPYGIGKPYKYERDTYFDRLDKSSTWKERVRHKLGQGFVFKVLDGFLGIPPFEKRRILFKPYNKIFLGAPLLSDDWYTLYQINGYFFTIGLVLLGLFFTVHFQHINLDLGLFQIALPDTGYVHKFIFKFPVIYNGIFFLIFLPFSWLKFFWNIPTKNYDPLWTSNIKDKDYSDERLIRKSGALIIGIWFVAICGVFGLPAIFTQEIDSNAALTITGIYYLIAIPFLQSWFIEFLRIFFLYKYNKRVLG